MRELLRVDEVAGRLQVSRSQVYAMARRGELPTVRFGERAVRFPSDELERWLAARIEGGNGPQPQPG